jgi:hypothetical protein
LFARFRAAVNDRRGARYVAGRLGPDRSTSS